MRHFLRSVKSEILFIAVNLVNDPTAQVEELKSNISPSDLFSFGQLEQSLVGSIDFTYRNVWNEIRTLHFEGQNAILLALKVLSNKIDQGVNRPVLYRFSVTVNTTTAHCET